MNKNQKNTTKPVKTAGAGESNAGEIPSPVDVVDGIPDRAASRPAWKYILLLVIFLAWVAFLIYCLVTGNAGR